MSNLMSEEHERCSHLLEFLASFRIVYILVLSSYIRPVTSIKFTLLLGGVLWPWEKQLAHGTAFPRKNIPFYDRPSWYHLFKIIEHFGSYSMKSAPPSLASMETPRSSYSSVSTGTEFCSAGEQNLAQKDITLCNSYTDMALCPSETTAVGRDFTGSRIWGGPKAPRTLIWNWFGTARLFEILECENKFGKISLLTSMYISVVFLGWCIVWVSRHWLAASSMMPISYLHCRTG